MTKSPTHYKEKTNKSITEYFKKSKSDWFEIVDNDVKKWDNTKVDEFWKLIRLHKIDKNDFDFSYFIFPTFDTNSQYSKEKYSHLNQKKINLTFWETNLNKEFNKHVNFNNSIFEGKVDFDEVIFGSVDFDSVKFNDVVCFNNLTFNEIVNFNYSTFNKTTYFKDCKFHSSANFRQNEFFNDTIFMSSYFGGEVYFNDIVFHEKIYYLFSGFDKEVRFNDVTFEKETMMNSTGFFNGASFSNVKFSRTHETTIEDLVSLDVSKITRKEYDAYSELNYDYFEKVSRHSSYPNKDSTEPLLNYYKKIIENKIDNNLKGLSELSEFRLKKILNYIHNNDYQIHVFNLKFTNINFPKLFTFRRINLTKCDFHKSDLNDIQFKECDWGNEKRIIFDYENRDFHESESIYRQIKKNYESNKNWELSGMAYISEMEMRRKRLWKEKDLFQWLIYSFYGHFGGYNQDFKKPIISIAVTIFIFSFFYYFIDYDIIKALQRGTKGALPYISIDTEKPFKGYWLILKNIELILGGTFLSFFILALRKRFKQ